MSENNQLQDNFFETSEDKRVRVLLRYMRVSQSPFPPPDFVAGYEHVEKGSGGKIIDLAIRQAENRMDASTKQVDTEIKITLRGQIFAFVLSLVLIISMVVCALLNHQKIAFAIATTTILGVVRSFLPRKNKEKTETEMPDDKEADDEHSDAVDDK